MAQGRLAVLWQSSTNPFVGSCQAGGTPENRSWELTGAIVVFYFSLPINSGLHCQACATVTGTRSPLRGRPQGQPDHGRAVRHTACSPLFIRYRCALSPPALSCRRLTTRAAPGDRRLPRDSIHANDADTAPRASRTCCHSHPLPATTLPLVPCVNLPAAGRHCRTYSIPPSMSSSSSLPLMDGYGHLIYCRMCHPPAMCCSHCERGVLVLRHSVDDIE